MVSEKSLGFGFGKFGLTKKYWFRKIFVSEISLGFGFGKFVIGKKVSVSVKVKILVSSFSAFHPIHPSALNELNRPKIDLQ